MTTNTSATRTRNLAAAVLAGLLALAGCASGSTPAPDLTASRPAAGSTQFTDYSVNSDGPGSAVIVTGAVGDYGHGESVFPDGQVDPDHTSELELRLTRGTFRLQITALDRAIQQAFRHWPSSRRTCSGSITASAAAPVIASSGTGSYRGISGTFAASATISEVDSARPACLDGTGAFLAQIIVITGTGTVTLRT
jgi:hypothetical protein